MLKLSQVKSGLILFFMKEILNFLIKAGKLKEMPRRGWVLRGVKEPETIAAHTFRMAIMAWVLCCYKKLNLNKVIKMALIHDLCEVYAGDTTPYDKILPRNKKKLKEIISKWPRFLKEEKEKIFQEKHEKESKALKKITSELPTFLRKEIRNLWFDYENGLTHEGKFVRQLDRVESLLQASEYFKKNKDFSAETFWIQAEELIDDPLLLKFIKTLERSFYCK